MDEIGRVGILGIGGANSIGFELAIALYNSRLSPELPNFPDNLFLYNRPPKKGKPDRHIAFLRKMETDFSKYKFSQIFGKAKKGGVIDCEEKRAKELHFEQAQHRISARCCSSIDDLLERTDTSTSVIALTFEAAGNWYKWFEQASPEEKRSFRKYLFYHNFPGTKDFAESLIRFADKHGHYHKAHKISVTNPTCRINDTIRMIAGQAAGPPSKFTAYGNRDAERIFKTLKQYIKDRFSNHTYDDDQIKFIASLGLHASNIPRSENGESKKIINSIILWSAIRLAGVPFYDIALSYEKQGYDIKTLKEEIEKIAHSEHIKELARYSGKTTAMIVPSLCEIVQDIISNKSFDDPGKTHYSMGQPFKLPGTDDEVSFLYPLVYKDGHAWVLTNFDENESLLENIEYNKGEEPAIRDTDFLTDNINKEEAINALKIIQSTEKPREETKRFIEDKKFMKKTLKKYKNVFKIKKEIKLPSPEQRLESLIDGCETFLKKERGIKVYESYIRAIELVSNLKYTCEDVDLFSRELRPFVEEDNFNMMGYYISALMNNISNPNNPIHSMALKPQEGESNRINFNLDFEYLKKLEKENKEINNLELDGIGTYNKFADIKVKGDLGYNTGYGFLGGSLTADITGHFTGTKQKAGLIKVNQAGNKAGAEKQGGELQVRKAGKYLGYKMWGNGTIKAEETDDFCGYGIRGGFIEVETAKHGVGENSIAGRIDIKKSYYNLSKSIGDNVEVRFKNRRKH